jgi:primosomal protein N''
MNTSALKSFAPAVRRQLMEAVERKLDYALSAQTADLRAAATQVSTLRYEAQRDRAGLVERVAYTWFNRLAALRFLDARGWHPFGCRVLTPTTPEETQPELLKLMHAGALPVELAHFTDPARLNDLLDGRLPTATPGADPQGEVYHQLILAACRYYHDLLPFLFEALDDETELLLPDDLLTERSVTQGFRTEISDDDCAEVEVLGWLYQFYISEKKDAVMARKKAVPSEDIPAVTQLFTPHWIVRYLVENSLGRLWLLNHPASKLREHMPYYIEGDPETDFLKITRPEEIRLLDPACGSGHMLTYAFDLLYRIYEEEGYAPSEIPEKILTHNLHGLEICPRATQLAQFALVCKAREKSRTAFRQPIQPKVMCLQDVVIGDDELRSWLRATRLEVFFSDRALEQLHQFEENTATFGSLIQPLLSAEEIAALKLAIGEEAPPGDLFLQDTQRKVLLTLEQAEMLSQRYDIVVTNPPYMGGNQMDANIKEYAGVRYSASRTNLFAMFIERSFTLAEPHACAALITMQNWMFLSSFAELRNEILSNRVILSMLHLGAGAFDTIGGEVVQTTAFVIADSTSPALRGIYMRLTDGRSEIEKANKFVEGINEPQCGWLYRASAEDFRKIPGHPIAYWISQKIGKLFSDYPKLGNLAEPKIGMRTGDNEHYLRRWHETSSSGTYFPSRVSADNISVMKWIPYNKGGTYRKWYGNFSAVVNWANHGYEIKKSTIENYPQLDWDNLGWKISNEAFYFKEALTWTDLSTTNFGVRYLPEGFIFDAAGPCLFCDNLLLALSFLLTKLCFEFLKILNPTLHFKNYNIAALPFSVPTHPQPYIDIASECICIARFDWDNLETSWDFRDLPLLRSELKGHTLKASWRNWDAHLRGNIARMQMLETENNRLWIEAYGLQDELSPDVPEDQITLARPNRRKDVAAFLSYAIGCMMGRYSVDKPGLILADAGDTLEHYLAKVGKSLDALSFVPDQDGIIPVLDGEWFEDDIVARTRDFLRVTFGEDTLEENVRFIEESLGKDLRKYFVTDFYKDHLQTYKKRPIYWLFQSPKKGFQCLIYLHRYTRDTANRVLNRYLREYLAKLRARIEHLERELAAEGLPAREKTRLRKESEQLRKTLHECEDWERSTLLPLAQQRIELDLDDGVKVNYLKLGNALAPIPGLEAKEED